MAAPAKIVVMGVSGCGKTTVARALADHLGAAFVDADDLHPGGNVAKMSRGVPLTEDDRRPWLDAVGQAMAEESGSLVVACSALRRAHRDRLRTAVPDSCFVLLDLPRTRLRARLQSRVGHFMPASLLDSQIATLEPFQADERGLAVDADTTAEEVVDRILGAITT